MMKRIVLSILSLVMAFVAMANPVGVEQARKVGASWLSSRGHYGAVKLAVVESPFADIYVFNADGGGFVIVAADDCARPILGYSLTGSFRVEQMPANVRSWLKLMKKIRLMQMMTRIILQSVPAVLILVILSSNSVLLKFLALNSMKN